MQFDKRVALPGSERTAAQDWQHVGPVPAQEQAEVTVILHRKGGPEASASALQQFASRMAFPEQMGADEKDLAAIEAFAHQAGLTVVDASAAKRRVVLRGNAHTLASAFGAQIATYRAANTDRIYRGRTGTLTAPEAIAGSVMAVLGLDNRPIAKPHIRIETARAVTGSFTPPQVAALYAYPTGANGSGQTVAIIELGGGYTASDLASYFQQLGIPEPSVTAVSVDGGKNTPGSDADGEVALDIDIVGAIAPGAKIAVYFAPNTDQGFVDAVTDAVHDTARKPSVISISWGGPENSWTQQSRDALNAALQDASMLGVTVTVASGDNGSSDGVSDGSLHVDFPAASPYALACGGTRLAGSGTSISSEVVWNEVANQEGATGGGVSTAFALPEYQNAAGVPVEPQTNFAGRGVPDVAGNADPSTGYQIMFGGQMQVVGGTSAVAPLWAALVAILNQQLGTPVGFLQPKLYALSGRGFRDITSGNNDDSNLGQYNAKAGWDACTGLGSPDGVALLTALSTAAGSSA